MAALAAIAPHLKEAALRIAICLAAEADAHQTVSISARQLARKTGLALSAVVRGIADLSDKSYIRTLTRERPPTDAGML